MPVTFTGITGIRAARLTFSRGISPSAFCLWVVPQDGIDVASGTLTISQDSGVVQLLDCAVTSCFMTKRRDVQYGPPVMTVWGLDRRWKWQFGSISGTYNTRIPPTLTANGKNVQQLMTLCLQAMGESGFDVSQAPQDLFPEVRWNGIAPALALADLCDRTACEVVLNWATNRVEIWQLGTGSTVTETSSVMPRFRFVPRTNVPSQVEVQGGESLYQHRLKLRAIGRQGSLQEKLLNDVDWKPTNGFANEHFNFPNVSSSPTGSAAVNQSLALATAWRQYKVVGQEGGDLKVPNCPVIVGSVSQYALKDYILFNSLDTSNNYQLLPHYVEGDYWQYADLPTNASNQVFVGPSTLYADRQIVEFPYPVVKLGSSGGIEEPTLYLQVAYAVKDTVGNPHRITKSLNLGGSGGKLILRRPEIFAAYTSSSNTEAQAYSECDKYLALFQRKFANPLAVEATFPGIRDYTLDGNIAQVTWSYDYRQPPRTTVCEQEELDVGAVDRKERRRRELLQYLMEKYS